jgi:fibrillarin-like rRNA methylase
MKFLEKNGFINLKQKKEDVMKKTATIMEEKFSKVQKSDNKISGVQKVWIIPFLNVYFVFMKNDLLSFIH